MIFPNQLIGWNFLKIPMKRDFSVEILLNTKKLFLRKLLKKLIDGNIFLM